MPTTTIRLSDELKNRIATVINGTGTTVHNFILEAIAEKTDQEELRRNFHEEADKRYATILTSGKTIAWKEMRHYLEDRAKGQTSVARPIAKKFVR